MVAAIIDPDKSLPVEFDASNKAVSVTQNHRRMDSVICLEIKKPAALSRLHKNGDVIFRVLVHTCCEPLLPCLILDDKRKPRTTKFTLAKLDLMLQLRIHRSTWPRQTGDALFHSFYSSGSHLKSPRKLYTRVSSACLILPQLITSWNQPTAWSLWNFIKATDTFERINRLQRIASFHITEQILANNRERALQILSPRLPRNYCEFSYWIWSC